MVGGGPAVYVGGQLTRVQARPAGVGLSPGPEEPVPKLAVIRIVLPMVGHFQPSNLLYGQERPNIPARPEYSSVIIIKSSNGGIYTRFFFFFFFFFFCLLTFAFSAFSAVRLR